MNRLTVAKETPHRTTALILLAAFLVVSVSFTSGFLTAMSTSGSAGVAQSGDAKTTTQSPTPTRQYIDSVPPRANATNPSSLIDISNQSDAEATRQELIQYIWNDEGFPRSRLPDGVDRNVTYEFKGIRLNDIENIEQIDRLEVTMRHNVTSYVYHLRPKQANGDLVVFMMGHLGYLMWRKATIARLVNEGYTVLAVPMPLNGFNKKPVVNTTRYGRFKLEDHDQFNYLETDEFSPIRYYLEPAAAALNYVRSKREYDTTAMVGISGGGWATTVYAALDRRITRSYPVAGTHPMYLRRLPPSDGDIGDYEQFAPELYRIANYLELYVLGSYGEGRKQVQILNQYDPCCFAGVGARTYAPAVRNSVDQLGAGEYELFIDDTHEEHQISDRALELIFEDIERASSRNASGVEIRSVYRPVPASPNNE